MKSLLGAGVVLALVGPSPQVSFDFVAQRISEVPLLLLWGAVLLFVGHHARARQVMVQAPSRRTSSTGRAADIRGANYSKDRRNRKIEVSRQKTCQGATFRTPHAAQNSGQLQEDQQFPSVPTGNAGRSSYCFATCIAHQRGR